jgi:hypothetical protein
LDEQNQTRVRLKISTTAKGLGQWEITSEFPTVEESAKNLSDGIDAIRKIMVEKNIVEAGKE